MRFALVLLAVGLSLAAQAPRFNAVTVSDQIRMGYQVTVCDVDRDHRPDLIVVDERFTELAWFENPGREDEPWPRHVLARDVPRTINVACAPNEIYIGHHFETVPARSRGTLLRLTPGPDVRQPWNAREVDRVPTIHRLRWANSRSGRLLVTSPLLGPENEAPEFRHPTPIFAHRPGESTRLPLLDGLTGIVHSVHPFDWNGDGFDEILTSSFNGIHLLTEQPGGAWTAQRLSPGDPRECPLCGSSELRPGTLNGRRFLAAIEPWHGNQLVVYPDPEGALQGRPVERLVLDDTMINGHALAVGDFDGDGRDEIVAGFRGKGFKLSLYQAADASGRKWTRHLIDETIAAADCQIADFNNDSRPDLACSGASTGNLKIYFNLGP